MAGKCDCVRVLSSNARSGHTSSDTNTGDNVIVVKIREATKRAAIDDSSVPNHTKGPQWHTVLTHWSSKIACDFKERNAGDVRIIARQQCSWIQCDLK
jgi:hypothetical protein